MLFRSDLGARTGFMSNLKGSFGYAVKGLRFRRLDGQRRGERFKSDFESAVGEAVEGL